MNKKLLFFIDILMSPFRFCITEWVAVRCDWLLNACYASIVRGRFKSAQSLQIMGFPLRIRNGKQIELGKNVSLGRHIRMEATVTWMGQRFNPKIVVGDNAVINALCHIGCVDEVRIGKFTTLAERVYVTDHLHGESMFTHMVLPPRHRPLYSKGKVLIGDYVSIGEGCVILPGVTIGDHCIIGSNAVVTKDVPPYSIVGGIQAKIIKTVEKS